VARDTTRDDLLQELASQLERTPRYAGEQVRLVTWIIEGSGPLLDRMALAGFRDEFLNDLLLLGPVPGVTIQTHAFELRTSPEMHQPGSPAEDLAAEFAMRLEQRFAQPAANRREWLAGTALRGRPWEVKLDSLLGELDAAELTCEARRLALSWFATEAKTEVRAGEEQSS
jgi:hypothetical protein